MSYDEIPRGLDGRSGLIEWMLERAGLEGEDATRARLLPVMLDVSHVRDTEDAFRISDGQGFIPTSEEFWTLVDYVARFYRLFDDEEIEAHNRNRYLEREREMKAPVERTPRQKKEPKPGYVYLLEGAGSYKIGRAQDPLKRSETLAIQLPYPVTLLHSIPANDPRVYEAELHERFADKRLNGEWFDLSDADVAYIKGLGE